MSQKLNIRVILRDHLRSLRNDRSGSVSFTDIIVFYGLPVALGVALIFFSWEIEDAVISSILGSLSFFAGLLFSAQVALYSVRPKESPASDDPITEAARAKSLKRRKDFFKDLNANISYMILVSAVLLLVIIVFEIAALPDQIEDAIVAAGLTHFFLNLIMLIKRMHLAFKTELDD